VLSSAEWRPFVLASGVAGEPVTVSRQDRLASGWPDGASVTCTLITVSHRVR
jgi:hypothetical protein